MALLFAELISPERRMYAGEVRSVVLPSVEGDMTVLPGHAPLVTALHAGVIFATDATGAGRRAFISGGFAEVRPTQVTILAERVRRIEELTRKQIDEEILLLQMERDSSSNPELRAERDVTVARLESFKASLSL